MQRNRSRFILLALVVAGFIAFWFYRARRENRFDPIIRASAARYTIEPALVKAVIWRESAFDPSARGAAGETGLMQLRPPAAGEWATAERNTSFAVEHLLDPRTNTLAGTWYLGHLLPRYRNTDNPWPYVLADYNAGRSHVLRWMQGPAKTNSLAFVRQIDFPGTRHYIESVLAQRENYRRAAFR